MGSDSQECYLSMETISSEGSSDESHHEID